MKRATFTIISPIILLLLFLPSVSFAGNLTIRPFLIDETLQPRDSVVKVITLTSDYPIRKALVYATVNEITIDADGEIKEFVTPVMTDRTDTITSWVQITRGRIEINPGEKIEVPITLKVHPFAKPGEYHAFVGFVEATTGDQANAVAMAGDADGVIVKITIADQRKDNLRISSFLIDRFVTNDDKRAIDIEVENLGDLPAAPAGEIVFYDSQGAEMGSVVVNEEGKVVEPGNTIKLESLVPLEAVPGRYKANLSLHYGDNQQAALYDTTFFYLIPKHLLFYVFGGILILSLLIVVLFRRVMKNDDDDYSDGDAVAMYVREGHDPKPQDHDIDLKNIPRE